MPQIKEVMNFQEAVQYGAKLDVVLLPYELAKDMKHTREILEKITPGQSVGIFIGPEGGYDKAEIAFAKQKGVMPVTLGQNILRAETAAAAACWAALQ